MPLAGAVVAGGAVGAGIAALTPTKDESLQTKLSAGVAAVGVIGGFALVKASGRMPDGGMVAALLGAMGVGGGAIVGGAALGSLLVDRAS